MVTYLPDVLGFVFDLGVAFLLLNSKIPAAMKHKAERAKYRYGMIIFVTKVVY